MEFLVNNAQYITLFAALVGIVFAIYQRTWILQQPTGTPKMNQIAGYIQRGASAFLKNNPPATGRSGGNSPRALTGCRNARSCFWPAA